MLFKSIAVASCLVSSALAYSCQTNLGKFTISTDRAEDALKEGGKDVGKSGYPHSFGGSSGSNAQLKFYGANPKCNEKNPKLLEFPVTKSGKQFDKNGKHGNVGTPARVVYLDDDKQTLCGVMTHVIENKDTHAGSGDFRVCD